MVEGNSRERREQMAAKMGSEIDVQTGFSALISSDLEPKTTGKNSLHILT